MRTILDESALEAPEFANTTWFYVRSLIDPYALIAGRSGEVYTRSDGQRWEHGGYKVHRERDGVRITREIGAAYGDSARYPYAATNAA